MASGLHRIASFFPELQFRCDTKWGSQNSKARGLIRESIVKVLSVVGGGLDAEDQNQIFILKGRPVLKSWAISISHSPSMGGWAAIPLFQNGQNLAKSTLGLDIETAGRVTLPVVQRMCKPAEIAAAPNPLFLWASKEAAYKSVPADLQPQVISQLQITSWNQAAPDVFEYKSTIPGLGIFTEMGGLHYALFKT